MIKNFYTPNNFKASLPKLTGRSEDLDSLFERIKQGRSTALIGERRIGKSLVLLAVEEIINKKIDKSRLIDAILVGKLENWQRELNEYVAVLIDISINEYEKELVKQIIRQLKKQEIEFQSEDDLDGLSNLTSLFDLLSKKDKTFIILIDEMDHLEGLRHKKRILNRIKNAAHLITNISFVLTGAHYWTKEISQDTVWNKFLTTYYLKRIEKNAAKSYLIKPIADKLKDNIDISENIYEICAGKPYLIQTGCEIIVDCLDQQIPRDKDKLITFIIQNDKEDSLIKSYYQDNILQRDKLNLHSQILNIICHKPNIPLAEIVKYSTFKESDIKPLLNDLNQDNFETIKKDKSGNYSLQAPLISQYVVNNTIKPSYNNTYSKQRQQWLQWGISIILIGVAYFIYQYTNPHSKHEQLGFNNVMIELIIPGSIEENKKDSLRIIVKNISKVEIDSFVATISSQFISFTNAGMNSIFFLKLEADSTREYYTNISFLPKGIELPNVIGCQLSVSEEQKDFYIEKRLPMSKYGELLTYILGILGVGSFPPLFNAILKMFKAATPSQ